MIQNKYYWKINIELNIIIKVVIISKMVVITERKEKKIENQMVIINKIVGGLLYG